MIAPVVGFRFGKGDGGVRVQGQHLGLGVGFANVHGGTAFVVAQLIGHAKHLAGGGVGNHFHKFPAVGQPVVVFHQPIVLLLGEQLRIGGNVALYKGLGILLGQGGEGHQAQEGHQS